MLLEVLAKHNEEDVYLPEAALEDLLCNAPSFLA